MDSSFKSTRGEPRDKKDSILAIADPTKNTTVISFKV